jgi:hypothetical protein
MADKTYRITRDIYDGHILRMPKGSTVAADHPLVTEYPGDVAENETTKDQKTDEKRTDTR